jgi:hypothetical protein
MPAGAATHSSEAARARSRRWNNLSRWMRLCAWGRVSLLGYALEIMRYPRQTGLLSWDERRRRPAYRNKWR